MPQINTIVRPAICCGIVAIASFASFSAPAAEKETPAAAEENWVASDNQLLSLRIFAEKPRVAKGESIRVVAELRNDGEKPLTVIRPYGDPYKAQTCQIKLWSGNTKLPYKGPKWTYVVGGRAFVTLEPGEVCKDTLELHIDNFPGGEKSGRYALRFDYSYFGEWAAFTEKQGVKNPWHGWIGSREIQVERE